jgi:uncharacterized membrane protein (UPF0127 family)
MLQVFSIAVAIKSCESRCNFSVDELLRSAGHGRTTLNLIHNGVMKKLIWFALFIMPAHTTTSWAQEPPQLNLQRVVLKAGFHQIDTQLAMTPEQRSIGLMHRRDMPQHEGMLFVFPEASKQCFWMKNTLIPLTAAFVADDGTIVNLKDMKPLSTDSHCSDRPVRFVLEMNVGWFAKKGLKAGSKISGMPFGN